MALSRHYTADIFIMILALLCLTHLMKDKNVIDIILCNLCDCELGIGIDEASLSRVWGSSGNADIVQYIS